MGLTAQPVETIRRKGENKLRQTYARIRELIAEYDVEKIVVGLPKHMNGELGERAEKSQAFAEELEKKVELPVELWDERLTTVAADRIMDETGVRNHKEYVDELAAMLILQGYLDRLNAGLPVPGGIEDEDGTE
jgi:putative Holliday junction resolvase